MSAKKRKIDDETRTFITSRENDYLFIFNEQKKTSMFSLFKRYGGFKRNNLKRHYMINHLSKYEKYIGDARECCN